MGRLGPGHWSIQPWSVEENARQVEKRALGAVRSLQGGLARTAKKVRHLSNVSNATTMIHESIRDARDGAWESGTRKRLSENCRELAAIVRTGDADGRGQWDPYGYHVRMTDHSQMKVKPLVAEELSLPASGGEPVEFLSYLPPDLTALMGDARRLFGDLPAAGVEGTQQQRGARRGSRPRVTAKAGEYAKIIDVLMKHHMVELSQYPPLRINGMFGVPKDGTMTRLITNAGDTNSRTASLPSVRLPNPSILQRLPPGLRAGVALDINSFYNCMQLDKGWRPYFGFPPIQTPQGRRWPVNTTLPMGWTGSVLVGQLVHKELFTRCLRSLPKEFAGIKFVNLLNEEEVNAYRNGEGVDKVIFYAIYIDDFSAFGVDGDLLNALLRHLVEEYRKAGFPTKESKLQWAAPSIKVLGVQVDLTRGRISATVKTLKYLFTHLPSVARMTVPVPATVMNSLLGKLVWPFLLKRPLLAVLGSVFAFVRKVERCGPQVLWPSVRQELRAAWALLPFLSADFATMDSMVVASDATGVDASGKAGYGVTYSESFPVKKLSVVEDGWIHISAEEKAAVSWKVAVQGAVESTKHVNIQEMLAFMLAGRVVERHGGRARERVPLMLVDNKAVIGAVSKGRSGSWHLNTLLRKWAAFLLTRGWCLPEIRYIPSEWNPADGPSRAYRFLSAASNVG